MPATFLDIMPSVASLPFVFGGAYLSGLAVLSGRRSPSEYPEPTLRFDVVIPPHAVLLRLVNARDLALVLEVVRRQRVVGATNAT